MDSVTALCVLVLSALLSTEEKGLSSLQLYFLKQEQVFKCLDRDEYREKAAPCAAWTAVQMQFTFS